MDANKWTDKKLESIEKKISNIYKRADKEVEKKAKDYFKQFEKEDKEKKIALEKGELTNSQYTNWRKIHMATGKQFREMKQKTSAELTRANQRATAYVNGKLPEVYMVNYNAVKTDVDGIGGYSFDLVNEDAVKYVFENIDNTLLPTKTVDVAKDVAWNSKKINSEVLQGIIQGESIDQISGRLKKASGMSESAAVRNARTMVTGAQNHGKLDSYRRAQDDGIDIKKEWLATLDSRTRPQHGQLDGQVKPLEEPFENEFGEIMYPADPAAAPANVYACRCTLIGNVGQTRGKQRMTRDSKTGKSVLSEDMTYQEWYEARTGKPLKVKEKEYPKSELRKDLEESKIKYLQPKNLAEKLSSMEIAEKLAGGDMTGGSCASLSMAYAANKGGQDVLDFRGGDSMKFFSKGSNLDKIAQLQGVEGYVVSDYDDFKTAKELLKNVVEGKEYAFGVGKHMAIIRKGESGFEYLEMQSAKETGFRTLDSRALKWRFGCQKSHSFYGTKYKISGELIEVESLGNNPEFQKITGYINTLAEKQQKGALGGIK